MMALEYAGFTLKPTGFFAANAAGDIAPERNARSILSNDSASAGSCFRSN
ncbi:hypothetical protein GCM10010994_46950 [Chelatococcus reniformis]|uniref:Uncharacterized protein n=1 Tax=Chelatococcus reniformis TaxID=1494448 RepID=A0A916URR3_9HYPH|nr:hypothetical protein GCM10010994_46950 [Chelatococcus reniformis]